VGDRTKEGSCRGQASHWDRVVWWCGTNPPKIYQINGEPERILAQERRHKVTLDLPGQADRQPTPHQSAFAPFPPATPQATKVHERPVALLRIRSLQGKQQGLRASLSVCPTHLWISSGVWPSLVPTTPQKHKSENGCQITNSSASLAACHRTGDTRRFDIVDRR
jgi:hypothetical protein